MEDFCSDCGCNGRDKRTRAPFSSPREANDMREEVEYTVPAIQAWEYPCARMKSASMVEDDTRTLCLPRGESVRINPLGQNHAWLRFWSPPFF